MMVLFVFQNAEGAVELLVEKEPHHLVGKGHFRQG